MTPDPVLVVDNDAFILGVLSHAGRARGLEVIAVQSSEEAEALLATRRFSVVVINLQLGGASGLDLVKRARDFDGTVEAVVISDDRRLSSALESYKDDVFAFVPKPFGPAQLFATVDRALERGRGALERSRLPWELQLLNNVAAAVAVTTDIGGVWQQGLERVAAADVPTVSSGP